MTILTSLGSHSSTLAIQEWEVYDHTLEMCYPWYAKTFIAELKNWNLSDWTIFEWRSTKYSTAWLAKKCSQITTVEDLHPNLKNDTRKSSMQNLISKYHLKNVIYKQRNIELKEIAHPILGVSYTNPINQLGLNSPYVNAILETKELYDCIIIDGLHYNACAKMALSRIKPNGIIIVNNCHRLTIGIDSSYIFELYKDFKHFSYYDPDTVDKRTDYWVANYTIV